MVNSKLHIICGNCGQDLTKDDMAHWEYIPKETCDDGEVLYPSNVFIVCKNCSTLHSLITYIKQKDGE